MKSPLEQESLIDISVRKENLVDQESEEGENRVSAVGKKLTESQSIFRNVFGIF